MSSTAGHLVGDPARARIASVVGAFLKIDPDAIDPQMPFALYGLDSVGSVELVAALESELGRELPEWLLPRAPGSGVALAGAGRRPAEAGRYATAHESRMRRLGVSQMLADSLLPADIRPPAGLARRPSDMSC